MERVIYELYHAFQKDLWDCPNNKDTGWIVEAGAEYFAQRLKSDVEGNPKVLEAVCWLAEFQKLNEMGRN